MIREEIAQFLEARPYYGSNHVTEIAKMAKEYGIPFCYECKDWYRKDDEHSIKE